MWERQKYYAIINRESKELLMLEVFESEQEAEIMMVGLGSRAVVTEVHW